MIVGKNQVQRQGSAVLLRASQGVKLGQDDLTLASGMVLLVLE